MIKITNVNKEPTIKMSKDQFIQFVRWVWHTKQDPPLIGFNRKRMPAGQRQVVEDIYDAVGYPPDFASLLNADGE